MKTSDDDMKLIHGSGNIYRDLGVPNPEMRQFRAILSARILGVLNDRKLTVRAAQKLTGINASEFSKVRNADLRRFSIERLMDMLDRLGEQVEVDVTFGPKTAKIKTKSKAKKGTTQYAAL